MKKIIAVAACSALALAAREVPEWFEKGVVAQVTAAAAANMPALAASGVTIVAMREESAAPEQMAAFTAAAHAAGLKVLGHCVCPRADGSDGLFVSWVAD